MGNLTDREMNLLRKISGERKETEQEILIRKTGLSLADLPDGIPLEEFIDEDGNIDYDGLSSW